MSGRRVAITIVTYNSAPYIGSCLEQALAQDHRPLEVIVVDNASIDGTRDLLGAFRTRVRVVENDRNAGFAAAQNQAMGLASPDTEWFLTLNPDVRLAPHFVTNLLRMADSTPRLGSICGKLLSASPDFALTSPPSLDSTGIYFTRELRHIDRGSGEADRGQYDAPALVFGGTGAACLYRKAMIEDVSVDGEFFDTDFFAYREDADAAWRAQLLGWCCVYTPDAVALHVRTVTHQNRNSLPPVLNMHSVKNRWLLRFKNITPDLYRRLWLPITWRDCVVLGGCLLWEWGSLPAFPRALRLWPREHAKRREIMSRKRISDHELARWFSSEPVSFPLPAVRG